jgi:hypothetical protein
LNLIKGIEPEPQLNRGRQNQQNRPSALADAKDMQGWIESTAGCGTVAAFAWAQPKGEQATKAHIRGDHETDSGRTEGKP